MLPERMQGRIATLYVGVPKCNVLYVTYPLSIPEVEVQELEHRTCPHKAVA
jgi:hypothetical protein